MLQTLMKEGINKERVLEYVNQTELDLLTPKNNNGIRLLGITLPYLNNRLELKNLLEIRNNLRKAISIITDK